jgi:outer membrane protein
MKTMMKNLSVILNAILFVALIVLYFLFFKSQKSNSSDENSTGSVKPNVMVKGGIVYINIDSVLNNYDMYIDIQTELQSKLKVSEDQLANQEKTFRKEADDFQYKVDRQLVTRSEADEIQQRLMKKQQDLYQLQQELQTKLAEEQQVAQRKVLNSIMEYLKGLEANKDYQFVLGTTFGGNVLYANENLNISHEVVKGINEKYKRTKEK